MDTELSKEDYKRRINYTQNELTAAHETARDMRRQNQELIRKLKDENKEYRAQLALLKKFKIPTEEIQINKKLEETTASKLKLDRLRAENSKLQKELLSLRDKLKELELNARRPNSDESPHMRQIRILENRLDKAMIKHNEAQSIRKTYEQIVARLRAERVGFDQQLAKVEKTLRTKEHDFEELVLLSHDANHAREMAQAELHRFEQLVWEEKQEMAREVAAKRALVTARMQDGERLEKRDRAIRAQKQRDAHSQEVGGVAAGDEAGLRATGSVTDFAVHVSSAEVDDARNRTEEYEEAFRRIKEATGVSDVNEVIQKFLTQEDTQSSLIAMTKTNEEKLVKLRRERKALQQKLAELKYSGGAAQEKSNVAAFDLFQQLQDANSKVEKARTRFQQVQDQLLHVRAGVGHLALLLSGVQLDGDVFAGGSHGQNGMSDANHHAVANMVGGVSIEDVDDTLASVDLRLQKLLAVTHVNTAGPVGTLQQTSYMDPEMIDLLSKNARVDLEDQLPIPGGNSPFHSPLRAATPGSPGAGGVVPEDDESSLSDKELQADLRLQRKTAKDVSQDLMARAAAKRNRGSGQSAQAKKAFASSPGRGTKLV